MHLTMTKLKLKEEQRLIAINMTFTMLLNLIFFKLYKSYLMEFDSIFPAGFHDISFDNLYIEIFLFPFEN
jgi:hypothetical protein